MKIVIVTIFMALCLLSAYGNQNLEGIAAGKLF